MCTNTKFPSNHACLPECIVNLLPASLEESVSSHVAPPILSCGSQAQHRKWCSFIACENCRRRRRLSWGQQRGCGCCPRARPTSSWPPCAPSSKPTPSSSTTPLASPSLTVRGPDPNTLSEVWLLEMPVVINITRGAVPWGMVVSHTTSMPERKNTLLSVCSLPVKAADSN